MSILKNLFAAVGAVTLGAVAVGVVLGATTAMTADDDDFDLDELRDDAPCDGCRKCAEKKVSRALFHGGRVRSSRGREKTVIHGSKAITISWYPWSDTCMN